MINIVVALATESRPLIEHFGLTQDPAVVGFRVFRGDGIRLVVTGLGRVPCAAGVATLGALDARDSEAGMSAWLNVGIAGHASHEVGEGVHAVRILEAATGRSWYPPRIVDLPGRGETLCTVDAPEAMYAEPYVYDMEASAFYATAVRYSTAEMVQVYKIVSDNRSNGVETVSKRRVRETMMEHLDAVEQAAAVLSRLADEISATQPRLEELEQMLQRWHFSVSQQHQLRALLRKWKVLRGGGPLLDAELNRCPSARSVLAEIEDRLGEVYRGAKAGES